MFFAQIQIKLELPDAGTVLVHGTASGMLIDYSMGTGYPDVPVDRRSLEVTW